MEHRTRLVAVLAALLLAFGASGCDATVEESPSPEAGGDAGEGAPPEGGVGEEGVEGEDPLDEEEPLEEST